ncbi:hypothetical protein HNQ51_002311 [Inhella inkyongensis]|uniref:Uncharacterized protein n=1 Tax=Inhella inkyongensis TaxID=392593 RepID=A0A840S5Y6_9BURK|nr:ribonucleotide reductase subunit alpha [Inhella inkyongensis]MBB5204992.1 hypothetical protein [Inhella inkyongensis]
MDIACFDDLLAAARAQTEPQRLLLVFAAAECEPDASPAQRAAHAAGEGGVLRPLMCVDKAPAELADFAALRREAAAAGPPWTLLFAAALSGRSDAAEVQRLLDLMLRRIETGELEGLIPFDGAGNAVRLSV